MVIIGTRYHQSNESKIEAVSIRKIKEQKVKIIQ